MQCWNSIAADSEGRQQKVTGAFSMSEKVVAAVMVPMRNVDDFSVS